MRVERRDLVWARWETVNVEIPPVDSTFLGVFGRGRLGQGKVFLFDSCPSASLDNFQW